MSYSCIIEKELDLLRDILKRAPLSNEQFLFKDQFPMTCSNCGSVFGSRTEYLSVTVPAAAGSLLFSEYGLQEFRNCTCGTTLTFWAPDSDRRDITHEGALKRAIFMNCFHKLLDHKVANEEDLISSLRELFEQESRKIS